MYMCVPIHQTLVKKKKKAGTLWYDPICGYTHIHDLKCLDMF